MKPIDLSILPCLIDLVEAECKKIPALDWKTYSSSKPEQDRAIAEAKAALEPEGAKFRQNSYAHQIRLAGFSASCTSSFEGALHNWVTAARKRLAA